MWILKNKKNLNKYIFQIVLFPIFYLLMNYLIKNFFQIGRIYGTFFREFFELYIKNV